MILGPLATCVYRNFFLKKKSGEEGKTHTHRGESTYEFVVRVGLKGVEGTPTLPLDKTNPHLAPWLPLLLCEKAVCQRVLAAVLQPGREERRRASVRVMANNC